MNTLPKKSTINAAAYEYSADVLQFITDMMEEEIVLDKREDWVKVMKKAVQIQRKRALEQRLNARVN